MLLPGRPRLKLKLKLALNVDSDEKIIVVLVHAYLMSPFSLVSNRCR